MSEAQTGVQPYYPVGDSQLGQQNYPNMAPGRFIGQEGRVMEARAMNNRFPREVQDPYADCFRVVRSSTQIKIPCTRNEYRRKKVRIPKQVYEKVPKRVEYTEWETREKKEPHSVKRYETAYRDEEKEYTIQVPKKITKMVKVTKRVPKTVYVDVVTEEPREETIMVSETRNQSVKIPYEKEVLEQQYRTVTERVPVVKYRTEYETVPRTVFEESWKTELVPVTNIVYKQIPVYSIVTNEDCDGCLQVDPSNHNRVDNYNQLESQTGALTKPTYNNQVKPHVETYPPYVETYQEAVPTNQVVLENKPQYVLNTQGMQNPDQATFMEPAPVIGTNETVQMRQSYEPLDGTTVLSSTHPGLVANDTAPQDVQREEKWVEAKYPMEYDTNSAIEKDTKKDGVLDGQQIVDAKADGSVHIEKNSVVENPKEVGAVVEDRFSQSPVREDKTKSKKTGWRRRMKIS